MLKSLVSHLFARPPAADDHYRRGTAAYRGGEAGLAADHFRQALRIEPGHANAWNDLGLALCAMRDFTAARDAFEQATARDPSHVVALLNLAQLLRHETFDYSAAEALYRQVLALEPGRIEALTGIGLSLQEQGMATEAADWYREALRRDPQNRDAWQFLLFALNLLPDQSPDDVFADHLRGGEAILGSQPAPSGPRRKRPAGMRIRVGFVSGDFRAHSTASFLLPLLRHLDRSRFDVWCYSTLPAGDPASAQFMALAEHWCEIYALPDEVAARAIGDAAIDVLVDLSGHTLGNRLGVFAHRPARAAVSWLGYLNTTGLASIDCRITDALADPPGASEAFHSEHLLRLPSTQWCFEPPADAPAVVLPDPASSAGGTKKVVFVSCNHVAKLNARVLGLWGRLLVHIPASRLLVLGVPGEPARQRIAQALAGQGVGPERVEFHGRLPRARYWQAISGADIALDPFPYNGGATTCECLWMGLPVITLAGRFGFARTGASILGAVGLSDLVAQNDEAYLQCAARLAGDPAALGAIRSGLRARMLASPLLDAPGFARAFEAALLHTLEHARC